MIGIENFTLIEPERLDDVLIGVRMDRLFKGLSEQKLETLVSTDVPVSAKLDIFGVK